MQESSIKQCCVLASHSFARRMRTSQLLTTIRPSLYPITLKHQANRSNCTRLSSELREGSNWTTFTCIDSSIVTRHRLRLSLFAIGSLELRTEISTNRWLFIGSARRRSESWTWRSNSMAHTWKITRNEWVWSRQLAAHRTRVVCYRNTETVVAMSMAVASSPFKGQHRTFSRSGKAEELTENERR